MIDTECNNDRTWNDGYLENFPFPQSTVLSTGIILAGLLILLMVIFISQILMVSKTLCHNLQIWMVKLNGRKKSQCFIIQIANLLPILPFISHFAYTPPYMEPFENCPHKQCYLLKSAQYNVFRLDWGGGGWLIRVPTDFSLQNKIPWFSW